MGTHHILIAIFELNWIFNNWMIIVIIWNIMMALRSKWKQLKRATLSASETLARQQHNRNQEKGELLPHSHFQLWQRTNKKKRMGFKTRANLIYLSASVCLLCDIHLHLRRRPPISISVSWSGFVRGQPSEHPIHFRIGSGRKLCGMCGYAIYHIIVAKSGCDDNNNWMVTWAT